MLHIFTLLIYIYIYIYTRLWKYVCGNSICNLKLTVFSFACNIAICNYFNIGMLITIEFVETSLLQPLLIQIFCSGASMVILLLIFQYLAIIC